MSFAVLRRIPLGSFARVGRLTAPSAQMVVRATAVQGRFLSSTPEPTNGGNKDSFDQVLRKALKDKPELEEFIAEVEHSTGLEREELIRTAEGDPAYGDTYLSGPFGTLQSPVIVKSHFDSRIVGCVGGAGDEGHDLLWHEVSSDKMTICAECGQVFKLEKVGGHDDHHHH